MNYAMGIVLYNPSKDDVARLMDNLSSNFFLKYYIIDNSRVSSLKINCENVDYVWSGDNVGLSIAYNRMIDFAIKDNVDYLCLMDQDTLYPQVEIEKMQSFLNCYENEEYAIIAPRTYANRKCMGGVERCDKLTDVKYAINSGSFLNVKKFVQSGLRYDPQIFIDGVDFEMGMSLRKNGLKVGVYENSVFVQSLGFVENEESTYCKHSTFRYGLIAKNRIYIYKKHFGKNKGLIYAVLKNIVLMGKIILHEDNKFEKVKLVFRESI